ncbi:hypothetical protein FRC10_007754, partial [Ceratobasidium sp. 414]
MSEASPSSANLLNALDITQHGLSLREIYGLNDTEALRYPFDVLIAAALSQWRSKYYKHYIITIENVPRQHEATSVFAPELWFIFTCRYDPRRCTTQKRKRLATRESGTGNLGRAVKRCNLRRGVSDEAETTPSPEFTQAYFRALVVMWCAVNHRPFNAVSDPLFIDIIHLLRPSAHVPCPQTISSDLTRIYNRLSTDVRESFQETETAMHLAIDGWSSPLKASFLALILFWRENGMLWSTTLDFIHLTKAHAGKYMAEKTVECLERFGVRNQIVSMCLDNARNNDTFTRSIMLQLPNFLGSKMRARCVAHIANLIAKAFLDLYTRPASKKRRVSGDNIATPAQPSTAAPSHIPESDTSGDDSAESGVPLDPENDTDEAKEMFDQAEVK